MWLKVLKKAKKEAEEQRKKLKTSIGFAVHPERGVLFYDIRQAYGRVLTQDTTHTPLRAGLVAAALSIAFS